MNTIMTAAILLGVGYLVYMNTNRTKSKCGCSKTPDAPALPAPPGAAEGGQASATTAVAMNFNDGWRNFNDGWPKR